MTTLTRNVKRKTAATYRGREIMIDAGARTCRVREKGRREWLPVPWDAILHLAYKMKAAAARTEKLAAKKARRNGEK